MPLPDRTVLQQRLEAGILHLAAGEIHADEQRRLQREIALPVRQVGGGAFQREAAQRHDQARSLRNGR